MNKALELVNLSSRLEIVGMMKQKPMVLMSSVAKNLPKP